MPLKLIPPRTGKSPYYYVRGTHFGFTMDRSTKTADKATAAKLLKKWKEEIEAGIFRKPGEPTFTDAVTDYIAATGNERFIEPIVERIGHYRLVDINQQLIDATAIALYPTASPATRNRQVYTVISAILKHAGLNGALKRPKGSRGRQKTDWMTPEQAFRVLDAATRKDVEFGIFLRTILYTGMRLSEATGLEITRLDLPAAMAYIPATKTDVPRAVHLPPTVVAAIANHPRGLERTGRVFRFSKSGRLYTWLSEVKKDAGEDVSFVTFHTFRHTWATWMRQYGGLDVRGLVGTGAWADMASAARYAHVVTTDEAKRADMLPTKVKIAKKNKQRNT
ncbi:tyrosine-type recombinase/integrase [Brucella sp. 10RB9210]|nr:integrase [Brucella sp. 09RB8471]MRN76819.1 tyrosine-type recombinase/integrase [Brucella sp. 10RB9210]